MINGVILKKLNLFTDDRGWLSEVYRSDEIDLQPTMSYISQTLPGVVRGPHEHKTQSDFFIFLIGSFRLYLWDNRPGAPNFRQLETYDVGAKNPTSVIIPPGVVHAYKCTSDAPSVVINLPDQLYKGLNKKDDVDEIRWEIMPDSPFKVL